MSRSKNESLQSYYRVITEFMDVGTFVYFFLVLGTNGRTEDIAVRSRPLCHKRWYNGESTVSDTSQKPFIKLLITLHAT